MKITSVMRLRQMAIVVLRTVSFLLILSGAIIMLHAFLRSFYYFDASMMGGGGFGGGGGGGGATRASGWTFSLMTHAMANGLGFLVPGLVLLVTDRRIARWLIPVPRLECPGCGHGLAPHDAAKCPECGMWLESTSSAKPKATESEPLADK